MDEADVWVCNDLSIDREKRRMERRLPIGDTGYTVSNRGVVYNRKGNPCPVDTTSNSGTARVRIGHGNDRKWMYVNYLVLTAFGYEYPGPPYVAWYADNDNTNNDIDNLSWQLLKPAEEQIEEDFDFQREQAFLDQYAEEIDAWAGN